MLATLWLRCFSWHREAGVIFEGCLLHAEPRKQRPDFLSDLNIRLPCKQEEKNKTCISGSARGRAGGEPREGLLAPGPRVSRTLLHAEEEQQCWSPAKSNLMARESFPPRGKGKAKQAELWLLPEPALGHGTAFLELARSGEGCRAGRTGDAHVAPKPPHRDCALDARKSSAVQEPSANHDVKPQTP